MDPQRPERIKNASGSDTAEECLLKWFHLLALRPKGAMPAVCNVLTLRLGITLVNTDTQYVVDIAARTHDIAPALQQAHKISDMKWFSGNRRELWKS